MPISSDINTATKPIKKDILAPTKTRLIKSRPYLSVPKRKLFSCIKSFGELFGNALRLIVFSAPSNPSEAYSL